MKENRLKARLQRGEVCRGVSVMVPSPHVVEILGHLGFDWVLLDREHAPISIETLELMAMAADAVGITSIARPRSSDSGAILEVLERGVAGIQVPHVESGAEAEAVVEAALYHPRGRRGLAARTRPAGYGVGRSLAEYTRLANEHTLVCVQVESRAGLDRLDEILEVDGVDVVFLGPSDLSQSLGHPGAFDHPDVHGAMEEAFHRIARSGRAAGSAGDAARWQRWRDQGATYLYTHLPTLLAAGSGPYFDPTVAPDDREPQPIRETRS